MFSKKLYFTFIAETSLEEPLIEPDITKVALNDKQLNRPDKRFIYCYSMSSGKKEFGIYIVALWLC